MSEEFTYNSNVAFYLNKGWKLVSPNKMTCPVCNSALIQNPRFDFLFCIPCQAKVRQQAEQDAGAQQVQVQEQFNEPAGYEEQEQQAEQEQEDQTGALLLQGWTMTNRICPASGCHSPLMQQPGTNKFVCGKCGTRTIVEDPAATQLSFSVNAGDLARDIVQNVERRLQSREYAEVSEEQEQPRAQMAPSSNATLLGDLKAKIAGLVQEILEPCSFEEIERISKAIGQLHQVYKVVEELQ